MTSPTSTSRMAADSGRPSPSSHATQVCRTCKARKKKCDKVLPRCGYCSRKGLDCGYTPSPRVPSFGSPSDKSSPAALRSLSTPLADPSAIQISAHVHSLLSETGLFADDVTSWYFRLVHRIVPVVSRRRFHDTLTAPGNTPPPGTSALLLVMCLITSSPRMYWRVPYGPHAWPIEQSSLHLAAKSLLVQVQAMSPPTIHLIQATLLLAVYEYAHDRPEDAFVTVAGCTRMAYAAGLHRRGQPSPLQSESGIASPSETGPAPGYLLEEAEASNTWWGIIICERMILCNLAVPDQPLLTATPSGDTRLPTDLSFLEQRNLEPLGSPCISPLDSTGIGGFGRAAQAVWLLDQVLQALKIPDPQYRFSMIQKLDVTSQDFLMLLLRQSQSERGALCEASAITGSVMFILHQHILNAPLPMGNEGPEAWEERRRFSHEALDTVAKIIAEVALAHQDRDSWLPACVAPSYPYIVRNSLKYISERRQTKGDSWLLDTEHRLRTCIDHFESLA